MKKLLIRARSDCKSLRLILSIPEVRVCDLPVFAQGKLEELKCGNCGSENLREIKKEPVYSGGLSDSGEFPAPVRRHVGDDYVLVCKDCGATNIYVDQWMYID